MSFRHSLVLVLAVAGCMAAGYWAARAAGASRAAVIDASKYSDLQSALDALPENGGIVQIPAGQFEVREPLVVSRSDVRILGAGTATHLVNRNEAGRPALIIRHAERPSGRARLWRVRLAEFRISGNPKSGDGVLADGVNELVIQGLAVERNGGNGINLDDCYENPRITNSSMTYNGKAGLHIKAGHDIVVNSNHFEENRDGVHCVDSFNLTMSGNNVDDHLGSGVVVENTCCSVLSGNMIEESQGSAIILDRGCYAVAISSNLMAANNSGGVELRNAWGVTVSANTFSLIPRSALLIGPESGRITVTGNNFSNSHVRGQSRRKEDFTYDGACCLGE